MQAEMPVPYPAFCKRPGGGSGICPVPKPYAIDCLLTSFLFFLCTNRAVYGIFDLYGKKEKGQRMMFSYILFDLDGTLTDPKKGICTCVQYALHKMGTEEPDLDKLEPYIGPPLLDSFMEFHGMTEEQGLLAIQYYRERFKDTGIFENERYPGAEQMLAACKATGAALAIASSKPGVFVRRILEHFHIATYFDVVVGSELDGTRGRKEEVVEEALRQLHELRGEKLTRENTAMVGDRKFDIRGAKENGIVAVGVSFGYAPQGELEAEGADFIADTMEQLQDYLTKGK